VQAIDFLRKGSYAPDIIKDHQTNVLCILHVGKNVRVKLEKKSLFPAICDLVEVVKENEVVIDQLTSERNDQTVWDPIVI
jgi:hypothetical protein